jgi:hypothetical protein
VSGSVFATRWDLLHARVLIGVDRSTGVFSGSESSPGQQMVAVWTSHEIAEQALHVESWELRPILVRDLVALVPAGIGIVVDPERPTGMTASPAYVAGLRPLLAAFPTGLPLRVAVWDELEAPAREAVLAAAEGREVHAFAYRVDDSPAIGCVAVGGDAPQQLFDAVQQAVGDPSSAGVAFIRVVRLTEVPSEMREAVGDAFRVRPSRRRSLFRRR